MFLPILDVWIRKFLLFMFSEKRYGQWQNIDSKDLNISTEGGTNANDPTQVVFRNS